MLNFNFTLNNPFSDRWEILFSKSGLISKNKAWEANIYKTHSIVSINCNLRFKGDHAGLQVGCGVLGIEFEFHLYDTRHWNRATDTWETYSSQ
jgi:hypothetical protein